MKSREKSQQKTIDLSLPQLDCLTSNDSADHLRLEFGLNSWRLSSTFNPIDGSVTRPIARVRQPPVCRPERNHVLDEFLRVGI